jgi:thiol-disulfide isomerase/thioredoxin
MEHSSLICVSFILLFFSCEEKKAIPKIDQIVLIFENAPDNTKHTFHNGWTTGLDGNKEITYFDDFGIKHFESLRHHEYDTIIIKSSRAEVEVTHAYRGIDKLCYLFQKGDTALFTYNGQKPMVSILNRDFSKFVLNYDIYRNERLDEGDFPDYPMFFNPWLYQGFKFKVENILVESDSVQKIVRKKAIAKLEKEHVILDSIRKEGHISDEEVNYFIKRSVIKLKIMTLQQELGFRPLEKLNKVLSLSDLELGSDFSLDFENQFTNLNIGHAEPDIYYNHHEELLDWMLYNYYSRKVGRVSSTIYNEGKPGAGSNLPNYPELYDTIKNTQLLSKVDKNILLLKAMENLIENSSLDQRNTYFEKFKEDAKDTAMVNLLVSKYHFDQYDMSNMLLVSSIGDTVEYDELLSIFRGNVIYVDFWASWCKPCIKERPFADKLEEKYKYTNVVFLYISIDTEHDRWLTSIEKRDTGEGGRDFILINKYTSKQFEEMNLEYIPRYMLIDMKGELVETYAPRPSDDKLIPILNSYLARTK